MGGNGQTYQKPPSSWQMLWEGELGVPGQPEETEAAAPGWGDQGGSSDLRLQDLPTSLRRGREWGMGKLGGESISEPAVKVQERGQEAGLGQWRWEWGGGASRGMKGTTACAARLLFFTNCIKYRIYWKALSFRYNSFSYLKFSLVLPMSSLSSTQIQVWHETDALFQVTQSLNSWPTVGWRGFLAALGHVQTGLCSFPLSSWRATDWSVFSPRFSLWLFCSVPFALHNNKNVNENQVFISTAVKELFC